MKNTDEYISEVSTYFLEKRGRGLFLPPKDIMTIRKWKDDGIPFSTVISGIERTFYEAGRSGKTGVFDISGLYKCNEDVIHVWKRHVSNREGMQEEEENTGTDVSVFENVKSFFDRTIDSEKKKGNLAGEKAFGAVGVELKEKMVIWKRKGFFIPEKELELKDSVEKMVFEKLSLFVPPDKKAEFEREVKEKIGKLRMDNNTLELTKNHMMRKRVFAYFLLPQSPFWFV